MVHTNLVGTTILGYTVTERLRSGSFGTVYNVGKMSASGRDAWALKHITIPYQHLYRMVWTAAFPRRKTISRRESLWRGLSIQQNHLFGASAPNPQHLIWFITDVVRVNPVTKAEYDGVFQDDLEKFRQSRGL